jgi:penicillin-binding protein 2
VVRVVRPGRGAELVVVGMVSQGGTGGTVAAPMVREVYDGIYGPGGLPGGKLASTLPVLRPDGSVAAP